MGVPGCGILGVPTSNQRVHFMEPTSKSSLAVPIAIVIGFALIAIAIYFSGIGTASPTPAPINSQQAAQAPTSNIRAVDENDYIRGNPNAPIMLVEYSDYDCPFCKQFHQTMNQIMDEYGVTGQVAWVYRQFPIAQLHPNAPKISEAALCVGEIAGNDAFWEFSDLIFNERGINEPTNMTKLAEYAVEVGASRDAYNNCLQSGRYTDEVNASVAEGIAAGIQGTPQSFLLVGNQQAMIDGAQPYDVLKPIIQGLIDQLEGRNPTPRADTPQP